MIFGEEYDSEKIISSSLSEDGHYLIMSLYYGSSGSKTEIYYKDLFNDTPVIPLVNDIDAEFYGSVAGDIMYMKTNWKASNWRIIAADLTNPSKENWSEVIPNSEAVIENFSLTGGKIFVNYLENVNSHVEIYTPDGKEAGEISFPSLGTVSGVYGHWDGNEAFYQFTSFHIPSTIYHYDLSTDEQEIWAQQNVPVNTDNIEVKQIWFQSKDGTKVPMFVVHKKGLELDGNNPTYLTGYGGFNSSYKPYFSSTAVLWVEQGGIYVVTNLRGGGEFGDAWHRAAMFEKKQNTFDDFIAAAEWLIENKYTSPSKLAIAGGSNGGLLVGAALTQRPDLFQAVLCSYPLLDMLRYHKFLVGSFWISEYGSADSAEQFEYIYKYSPYHNVHQGTKYPSVFFVTGDADTRVDPCHARKMTALLQSATTPDNPVLLYYDTKAGHSRGTPLTKRIDDQVVKIGFLSWQLGMNWE
ncbi:MAG: prolyl oligopeptidase family protein [Candidatus Zixiibacteriota bacterium]